MLGRSGQELEAVDQRLHELNKRIGQLEQGGSGSVLSPQDRGPADAGGSVRQPLLSNAPTGTPFLDPEKTKPGHLPHPSDLVVGTLIIAAVGIQPIVQMFYSFSTDSSFSAFTVVKAANDFVGIVVGMIVVVLWLALCFPPGTDVILVGPCPVPLKWAHDMLKNGIKWPVKIPLMPCGFVPRLGAFSMGMLLFASSTITAETIYTGAKLKNPLNWKPTQLCRVVAIEKKDWTWFSRLYRARPHYHHGNKSCYLGESQEGISQSPLFGKDLAMAQFAKTTSNIVSPDGEGDKICKYQCVMWRVFAFSSMLMNIGKISAGAAVVASMCEKCSHNLNQSVTRNSSPDQILTLLKRSSFSKAWCHIHSYAMCAVLLALPYLFFKVYVSEILDANGLYTVDFYSTFSLITCLYFTCSLRVFHPFKLRIIPYTTDIWRQGVDKFVVRTEFMDEDDKKMITDMSPIDANDVNDVVQLITVDLHQWLHMSNTLRAECLINYARQPDAKDVNKVDVRVLTDGPVQLAVHRHKQGKDGRVKVQGEEEVGPREVLKLHGWDHKHDMAVVTKKGETDIADGKMKIEPVKLAVHGEEWDLLYEDVKKVEGYQRILSIHEWLDWNHVPGIEERPLTKSRSQAW